jgi:HTH-type transcriptional regulator / antitoxin HigA
MSVATNAAYAFSGDQAVLSADYVTLCREVWLPRPIHDQVEYEAALAAIAPLWGREHSMTPDQADWFGLATGLIADYEDSTEAAAEALPLAKRMSALLDAHGLTATDFARLLGLEPSMGSKLLHGTRQLTSAHIRVLAQHFALPADYFLQP